MITVVATDAVHLTVLWRRHAVNAGNYQTNDRCGNVPAQFHRHIDWIQAAIVPARHIRVSACQAFISPAIRRQHDCFFVIGPRGGVEIIGGPFECSATTLFVTTDRKTTLTLQCLSVLCGILFDQWPTRVLQCPRTSPNPTSIHVCA